ncbi:MAG: HD domain-containing protein [Actinomycetota bacterium]|nr:HD domain-containing protein [Actinomycetota bacterium]
MLTSRILFRSALAATGITGVIVIADRDGWHHYSGPIAAFISVMLGAMLLYLRERVFKPLSEVIDVTNAVGSGYLKQRVIIYGNDEIGRLGLSINRMTDMLEQRLDEVSLLHQISRESTLSRNLGKVLDLILDKAINMHEADSGSIVLVDKKSGDLLIKATKNRSPDVTGEESGFPGAGEAPNCVSQPILLDEQVIGVLNLSCKEGTAGCKFSPGNLDFLATLANHAAAAINNAQLFEELRDTYINTVQALATAIEAKDQYTHGHSTRVAEYALAVAKELDMTPGQMEVVRAAAYLHDVGKIGIPEVILAKPGKLTAAEYEIIKTHPEISARIISPANFQGEVVSIVRHHHERIDGRGYPDMLQGENIPLEARILAVADSFDAMISARPYRMPMSHEGAKKELIRCSGTQFDKEIVRVFIKVVNKTQLPDLVGAEPVVSRAAPTCVGGGPGRRRIVSIDCDG